MKTVSFIPESRHHERTYPLSRQECHKHMKTVSFIPESGHHERTYSLSRQECHKHIKTVSFNPESRCHVSLTIICGNQCAMFICISPQIASGNPGDSLTIPALPMQYISGLQCLSYIQQLIYQ